MRVRFLDVTERRKAPLELLSSVQQLSKRRRADVKPLLEEVKERRCGPAESLTLFSNY